MYRVGEIVLVYGRVGVIIARRHAFVVVEFDDDTRVEVAITEIKEPPAHADIAK